LAKGRHRSAANSNFLQSFLPAFLLFSLETSTPKEADMQKDILTLFAEGTLADGDKRIDLSSLPWQAHAQFAGVFLKNLVTLAQTGGKFSCHLVKIEPGQAIGRHSHPASIELHEVVGGEGVCRTEQGNIPYVPGTMGIMAAQSFHEVVAGDQGLFMLAKFVTVAA
jgi:quercetin dioxygenase-like cupin family protein